MDHLSHLLKTNEFAKLCNVHKKTLLYYDQIDLFKPVYTDNNGYRYYSYHQYDTFSLITTLKEIDMSLKDIKTFIDNRSPALLVDTLTTKKRQLNDYIKKLQHMEQILGTVIQTTSQTQDLSPSQITLTHLPEEYVILSSPITSYDDHSFFKILSSHLDYCSRHALGDGHPIGALLPPEHIHTQDFTHIRYLFTKTNHYYESPHTFIKPSGLYVVGFHQGDYNTTPTTYRRLLDFIKTHNLNICGNSYEETLLDHLSQPHPDDYLTRISIQVTPSNTD